MIAVAHDPALRKFTARVEGQEAYLLYVPVGDGVLDYASTFVPKTLRGRGIASAIVRQALDYARQQQCRIVPSCWFVRDFLLKHPEFVDLAVREGGRGNREG